MFKKYSLSVICSLKLIFLIVLASCKKEKPTLSNSFNTLFQEWNTNKYNSNFNTIQLYKKTDSICDIEQTVQLKWLKHYIKAEIYYSNGKYLKSIVQQKEAISTLLQSARFDSLLAHSYKSTATCYLNLSKYDSALFFCNKAEALFHKLGNLQKELGIKTNKAKIYFEIGDNKKSLGLLDEIIHSNSDTASLLIAYHTKANIFGQLNKIDSALKIDFMLLKNFEKIKDIKLTSPIYNNLANCYYYTNKIDSAIHYCKLSYNIDSIGGDKKNASANLHLLANINYEINKLDASLYYFQKAIKGFNATGNKKGALNVFIRLKEIYEKEGSLKKALEQQDSVLSYKNKINNLEVLKTIELLNVEFETEKKNNLINHQYDIINYKNKLLIILIILFLLIAGAIYIFIKTKTRLQLLKLQQHASLQVIATEQHERMRIARELHDGIGQKLTVLKMYASVNPTENKQQIDLLDGTIHEVRTLSHNLMPEILSLGLFVALKDLCDKINISDNLTCEFKFNKDAEGISLAKDIEVSIYRIMQETLNNMLKHAQASKIEVELLKLADKLTISIKDNGVGFDTRAILQSKGIGWGNILTRAKIINANLEVNSNKTGTQINLSISV